MNEYVRVTKLLAMPDAPVKTATWETWNVGGDNRKSVPVDYIVEGYLCRKIEVGNGLVLIRKFRNGTRADGIFETSPITSYSGRIAKTQNSIYLVEKVREPEGL